MLPCSAKFADTWEFAIPANQIMPKKTMLPQELCSPLFHCRFGFVTCYCVCS